MKSDINPLFLAILFLFLFVSALLFLTHSYLQFKALENLRKKLGDKAYNWLIGEVEDDKV